MRYKGVVEGLERSDREIEEELFDEDNMLKSKMTQDRYYKGITQRQPKSHSVLVTEMNLS